MSQMFREKSQVSSKRYTQQITPPPLHHLLNSPFSSAAVSLSDSELRESAYEILIAACRSSGTRPLTYISQSEKASSDKTHNASTQAAPSLQRSLTSSAASKVKKALGMKSRSVKQRANCEGGESVSLKKSVTVGELVRAQMRVTEQTDSRIRRALLRIAAGQLGRRMETMVLPLELLQQLKPSDFPNPQDYVAWQRRTLKLLEAGLLLHPRQPLDKTDDAPRRLQQIIRGALEKPIDVMKNMELMQNLRSVVTSVACRSFDGSVSDVCHWADSFPLNMRIYQLLLEGCFDVNDESVVIEEIDEVLELIKKTWTMLGMSQMLHNLCFLWVLFHHYVATGQVEDDLIFAANNLLLEVEKDEASKNPDYFRTLSSILSPILNWAETRLNAYHNSFHSDNTECMEIVASLAVTAAKLLVDDTSHNHQKRKEADVPRDRIDAYIRSSLRTAFTQKLDKLTSSKNLPRKQPMLLPSLAILADDISQLAFREKAIFSPILKTWHPLAAGVAVATLHYCYGIELKEFVSSISELSPDVIQVLTAADKLEKDLVQIAVEDAVDSEDGGKSIIQEMPPYEAESIIANLVKSWIKLRVDRFKEWVDRNLQLETWNPLANKERFAPSAVEVLRVIDETLEAFFLLPIPIHSVVLPYLVTGLDKCLQNYVLKAKSGCESPRGFMPALPALTRCTTGSKFHVFKKKDKVHLNQNRKSQVGNVSQDSQFGIPQLCVRVNTLHHIRTQMEVLEKRTGIQLRKSESASKNDFANGRLKKFELSAAACVEGTQQLCEATAYKVVFHDLDHVLWNGLYIGEVSSSRIDPFLQELEQYLEIIASTVHDRVRTRLITDVMRASFDGFLLVLLAGGPSRAFTIQDYEAIEEDFKLLKDLFWSNGDGLPTELIDKFSVRVKGVLPLFHTDTENLVAQFKSLFLENEGSSAKSKLPLPPTSGQWSPTEPNTVLRILCHRKDEIASKFLKKTYNLPKKL